jgi:glucose/arabinose dehydrogenase
VRRLLPIGCTLLAAAAAAVAALAGCGATEPGAAKPPQVATESGTAHHFDVERVAGGLNRPTFVGAAPGDDGALWVLEQPGRVVRLADGRRRTVLDITSRVRTGAEQGLLGMAFDPDYARSGRLYLHWTDRRGDTRVAEFRCRRDHMVAPQPTRLLLHLRQPEENHNGGQLAFGPDGRLYLGLGDGGGAFDPHQTAQDSRRLLGKIVSSDVSAERPRWRVELYGLRNPWRFSFDPALGEIWVGDVGQDGVEEVNRVLLEPDEPPKNLGWSAYEGTDHIDGHSLSGDGDLIWPVATYGHDVGCSITGGVVYSGVRIPALSRRYVYGDFCSGTLWSLRGTPGGRADDVRRERAEVPSLTHIGTDSRGELVFASGTGELYRGLAPR